MRPETQVNKQKLAELTRIPLPDSAARMWRGIKAKIDRNDVGAPDPAPATPGGQGTPSTRAITPDTKNSTAVAASSVPASPSLVASMNKKKRGASTPAGGGGGKVKGRKRALQEEDDGGEDVAGSGVGGRDGAGERPKKTPKVSKQRNKPGTVKVEKERDGEVGETEAGEV